MDVATLYILGISALWGAVVGFCTMDVQTRNGEAEHAHTVRTLDGIAVDVRNVPDADIDAISYLYAHEVTEYLSR